MSDAIRTTAAIGATHISTPNGLVPVEEWQEAQRRQHEEHRQQWAETTAPKPAMARPERAELDRTLYEARQARAATAAQLARAEAALAKGQQIADSTRRVLRELDEAEAAAGAGLAERLRDWISGGALGDKPHAARLSVADVQRRQSAESDAAASEGAVAGLEAERDRAGAEDDAAFAGMCASARAILALDAAEIADRVDELKAEMIELQEAAWGFAFAAVPVASGQTAPLKCGPAITALVNAPPIRRDLPAAARTERGKAAVEAVRARFAELIGGQADDADGDPFPDAA